MPPCPDTLVAQKYFEEAAWVRVNLKKVPGKGRISKSELRKYITNFKDLLLKQLALYAGASIYVDCANGEGRVLLCELYPDLQAFGTDDDPWIYYSESQKLIVINSYHPSHLGITKDYYDNMREAVADFFKAHPHFGK